MNNSHQIYTDHKNNRFNSLEEMCEYHHVPVAVFINKQIAGYNLEQILETNKKETAFDRAYQYLNNPIISKCGLSATPVNINVVTGRGTTIDILFEDGAKITDVPVKEFEDNTFSHPTLKASRPHNRGSLGCFETVYTGVDNLYEGTCKKCGYKDVLTPQSMLKHIHKCLL